MPGSAAATGQTAEQRIKSHASQPCQREQNYTQDTVLIAHFFRAAGEKALRGHFAVERPLEGRHLPVKPVLQVRKSNITPANKEAVQQVLLKGGDG